MSVPVWKRNKSSIQYVYDAFLINKEINKLMQSFVRKMHLKHTRAIKLIDKIFYGVYSQPVMCSQNAYINLLHCSELKIKDYETIESRIQLLSKSMNDYKTLTFCLSILQNNYKSYLKTKTINRLITMINCEYYQLKKLISWNKKEACRLRKLK